MMEHGDEFIASRNLYGGSLTQFGLSFKKLGWTCHFVDPIDPENFRRALTPRCKAIFLESLANPGGIVVDLEAVAKIAHEAGIPLIVDNTLATPFLCRPIEWGADLVVHSTTKFLDGHGNSLGGVVVESGKFDWSQGGKFPALTEPEPAYHGLRFYENFGDFAFTTKARAVALRDYGPTLAPMNAFLTITGIETLHVRMERHCTNAQKVAEFLAAHPRVTWVSYAGLEASPVSGAGPQVLATWGRGSIHLRRARRLRGWCEDRRGRAAVFASRQHRRHAQPDPASGLDNAPPAERPAAVGGRRGAGRDPPVDRVGDGRGSDRRSRSGAGGGR